MVHRQLATFGAVFVAVTIVLLLATSASAASKYKLLHSFGTAMMAEELMAVSASPLTA